MISAEQLRNMDFELSNDDLSVLSNVERIVLQSVANMNNSCWFYTLPARVIVELRKLGYSVEDKTSQRDGTLYKISW